MANGNPAASVRSFMDLEVWQMGMSLSEDCYRLTRQFPSSELYGLTAQIRRCSVSVPSNIAEGHGRESTQSFIQFLRIAQGSTKELQTQLILASRVELTTPELVEPMLEKCDRVGKMLRSLIRSLERRQDNSASENGR